MIVWILSHRGSELTKDQRRRKCCRRCAMLCLLRMRRRLFTRQRAQIGGHGDITFVVNAPQHHRAFWHFPLMRDKKKTKEKATIAREPTTANRAAVNWVCVSGYNRGVCSVDMGAVSRVFADLSWRRGLCAKKPRDGIADGEKMTGGRLRRERGAGRRKETSTMRLKIGMKLRCASLLLLDRV